MSYLTFHSCQRTCENIKTPTFKSKLILAPAQSVWSWYEIENYENLEPHSFGSTKPISEAPQDEIDIESPIALAAKSRDQRLRPIPSDCSHNHQSSFFKLQLFFNEIIISYADSPHFFLQITSTNIDQGQNHVFLLFSSSQSSLTCGCLGTRRNGWDRDVLWEELLAENYKLLVAQAFYSGFCLHHHCHSYWHHHPLHLV